MKLVTAITALAALGGAHRFATTVVTGRTNGDVVLQGGGDPLLSGSDVRRLGIVAAKKLPHAAPITVHVDGDLFPPPTRGDGWASSVPRVQALALHGDTRHWPARHAGELFTATLRSHGLNAHLGANQDAPPDAAVIARFRGHSVAQSVAAMLSRSDTHIAEILFRQVAIAVGRHPTWTGARAAALDVIRSLGIDPQSTRLLDGSGISRNDRITPRFLAQLIHVARTEQSERFASPFRPTALPVSGRTGTLARSLGRYDRSPSRCATGKVHAKTGTIFRTIALSGSAASRYGLRIFSIVVNHRPTSVAPLQTRRAVDGLVATIVGCW